MQAAQEESSYHYSVPPSSALDLASTGPPSYAANLTCQQQQQQHSAATSTSGSTCYTPPEHTYSCPSSVASSFTETDTNTNIGIGFGLSPRIQSDLLYPPSKLSTVPFPATTASSKGGPYYTQQSLQPQQQYQQHHFPKSLSRSSISSDGSTLLFSPIQDSQQLAINYSPITPPLPIPVAESSKSDNSALLQQSLPQQVSSSAPPIPDYLRTAKPINKLPLLPELLDANIVKVDGMATTMPAVMQPGCISRLAQYLSEMVVYLWFSPPGKRAPAFPRPTLSFARFCNDILTTTQVSQSVVVLALYFISKLQAKHSIEPRPGSEYKLAIASLMLANKILDDHTYTNKTWSEVSGLPLDVLNGAEVEFLQGLDFDLHVSHTAYKAWFTMLQNGESSNIANDSQPARKKARVINPIAPSAPTSPMHHTSASSTAARSGLAFDFHFAMPSTAPMAAAPSNPFAPQIPTSRHSVNTWPVTAQLPTESAYMQQSYSQNATAPAASNATQAGSRKRRASDAALSPPSTSTQVPPSTFQASQASLQVNNSNLPQLHPGFLLPHIYTPMVSTPTSSMSVVSSSRATTPQSAHGPGMQQGYFVQDFMPNDLTSSWSPADEMGDRRPQDLSYYALAAGQQRGGYLTHQPLPPYPTYPAYQPGMAVYPQNGRAFAPLPRNVSRNKNMTPILQQTAGMQQRMSLSLSPVDIRHMYAQAQGTGMHAHNGQLHPYMQQQATYPMQGQNNLTPASSSYSHVMSGQRPSSAYPLSMQGLPMARDSTPLPSPLEPSLQNLVLSSRSASPGATPKPSRQPQPAPPQSYYSSFANNGLPGVLSWPAQALAQYQNTVQPHQQSWPQNFV